MTRLRDQLRNDDGVALLSVMGWMVILMIFMTAISGYALGGLRSARADQNWHAALGAAESGLDDFLYRLNQDTSIWQNPPDCVATPDNAQCGFVPVPGGAAVGEYTYTVDATDYERQGVIRVQSTGRVEERTRTVEASYRRENFLDYVYFTDYETVPLWWPQGSVSDPSTCARHAHATPPRNPNCAQIRFVQNDVIDGPFRTNDTILLEDNPEWRSTAFSSNPAINTNPTYPGYNVMPGQSANPTFLPGFPAYRQRMEMPPSNNELRDVARLGTPAAGRGCVYEGPTHVVLHDNGEMTVDSPYTQTTPGPGPGCPASGTRGSLPTNGVLYVDNRTSCPSGSSHPLRSGGGVTRLIPAEDRTSYGRCAGDLFIEGTLSGQLTAAAHNDIIITWHLDYDTYADSDGDLLGLAAQGEVWLFRPMRSNGRTLPVRGTNTYFVNPRIDAAILSLTSSFSVQNVQYTYQSAGGGQSSGPQQLGAIRMRGTIVQIFRGPVGTGAAGGVNMTGYLKDYRYDWRLQHMMPPFFIEPVAAQFRASDWAERPAQS